MDRHLKKLLLLFVSFCPFTSLADAVRLDPKGKQAIINISAANSQPVTVYVLSTGNESQFVTLDVQAPTGTKITSKTAILGSVKESDLLAKASGWTNASFLTPSGTELQTFIVGGKNQPRAIFAGVASEYYCGNSTAADIDEVIRLYQEIRGETYTRNQICQLYGYPITDPRDPDTDDGTTNPPTPLTPYIGETVQVLVRKDTCSASPKATYLVRFDLNFSAVPVGILSQGADIYIGATPLKYFGSKASSLKPVSDGKYSPRPLFLMSTTGGANETFSLVKWNRTTPSVKKLDIVATASWRGHSLVRVLAGSVLKGGKGVAEMRSEVGVYSVCFKLTRTRQSFNGYK